MNERGSIAVILVLAMTVLMGFSALVVDVGIAYGQQRQLQNAINSAALAGAQELPDTTSALNIAQQYAQSNGLKSSEIQVSFSSDESIIYVTGTETVNFIFARVLGIDGTTVRLSSAATKAYPQAFDYALFSGDPNSTLMMNGSQQTVKGSVHSNGGFIANGSNLTITGALEASQGITINGSKNSVGSTDPHAAEIAMPDFSGTVKDLAQQGGQYYTSDQNFDGSDINIQTPIYVDGNINVNGSHFHGNGTIVATGNIIFDGSVMSDTSSDSICFYSESGNIIFNGSGVNIQGIIYAPHGQVIINGANQTVNGRIIAQSIVNNGSGLSIISSPNDLTSLSSDASKLTIP